MNKSLQTAQLSPGIAFYAGSKVHPAKVQAAKVQAAAVLTVLVFGLVFLGIFPGTARADGDAAAGAVKAYTCLGCHGVKHYVNTYPTYHVPKLAGQHEVYLISALKSYRAGTRGHETMKANAGSLSDQDIADIAAFFANQNKK